jgi:hypothetical protein
MPTWQQFLRVLALRVSLLDQEFGQNENGNPNYGWEKELWRQEFLFSPKNMGGLDNGLLFGWLLCEAALNLL